MELCFPCLSLVVCALLRGKCFKLWAQKLSRGLPPGPACLHPPPPIERGRWSCPKQGSFSGLPCGLFVLPLPGNLQPWAGTGVSQGCAQQQAGECSFRWNWDPGSALHKDLGLGERIATNAFVLFLSFFYFPQMLLRELRWEAQSSSMGLFGSNIEWNCW